MCLPNVINIPYSAMNSNIKRLHIYYTKILPRKAGLSFHHFFHINWIAVDLTAIYPFDLELTGFFEAVLRSVTKTRNSVSTNPLKSGSFNMNKIK